MEYAIVKQAILKVLKDDLTKLQMKHNVATSLLVSIIAELLSDLRMNELYELNAIWQGKCDLLEAQKKDLLDLEKGFNEVMKEKPDDIVYFPSDESNDTSEEKLNIEEEN